MMTKIKKDAEDDYGNGDEDDDDDNDDRDMKKK